MLLPGGNNLSIAMASVSLLPWLNRKYQSLYWVHAVIGSVLLLIVFVRVLPRLEVFLSPNT